MAFDIYGNDLRRGFCEVHPHIGEEYPCSICFMEQRQRENREYSKRQQEDYHKSIDPGIDNSTIYNIDFNGHVMAGLKIVNGEIEVVGAMNGYGNGIKLSDIKINKL